MSLCYDLKAVELSNLSLFSRRFVTYSSFGFALTVNLVRSMHGKHGLAAHTGGAQSKLTSCRDRCTVASACRDCVPRDLRM